jgi:hypothetical protein
MNSPVVLKALNVWLVQMEDSYKWIKTRGVNYPKLHRSIELSLMTMVIRKKHADKFKGAAYETVLAHAEALQADPGLLEQIRREAGLRR